MEFNQSTKGAIPPPPGIAPNFANPDYISGGIIPIVSVTLSLSTLLLGLRVYTKLHIIPPFRADDGVMIAAWLFSTAFSATCLEMQNTGNGIHMWDIPLDAFVDYGNWASISELLYVPGTALPKVAILISYLRIFTDKKLRIAVYSFLCITLGYMSAICLVILRCEPIAKSWNLTSPGRCILVSPLLWAGILNAVTDVAVLLLPIPMLMVWDVPTRRKLVTGGVFATGTLTCILSAVRVYFVSRMQHTTDLSRAVVIPTSLSVAEANIAVVCGCLMVARPFVRRHLSCLHCSNPERAEQTWPHAVDEEQRLTVTIRQERRPKTNAGFGGVNSSAGWIWGQRRRTDGHASAGRGTGDLELRDASNWPLRDDTSPRRRRGDNMIEEIQYTRGEMEPVTRARDTQPFTRSIQPQDSRFERRRVDET